MARDDMGEQIKPFEVFPAQELSEGKPIVARLIGRRFDEVLDGTFEKPFDMRFAKMMVKTLSHLCATLGASYGYAERTEVSLYAVSHGGEARRLLSRIAGEASAKLSLLMGQVATFEARLYEFDSVEAATEYFRWRMDETQSLAIDRWCTHILTANGADPNAVAQILEGLGNEEKIELLKQNSVEFERFPDWQRRGTGVYVADDKGGARLVVDLHLPDTDAYLGYLQRFVA